jgi:hypothetical protein
MEVTRIHKLVMEYKPIWIKDLELPRKRWGDQL